MVNLMAGDISERDRLARSTYRKWAAWKEAGPRSHNERLHADRAMQDCMTIIHGGSKVMPPCPTLDIQPSITAALKDVQANHQRQSTGFGRLWVGLCRWFTDRS